MSVGTVSRVGNSRAVFIPTSIEDDGFSLGSKVQIEHVAPGIIVVRATQPERDRRLRALSQLEGFANSQPDVPWEDDSREADRALMGQRYV